MLLSTKEGGVIHQLHIENIYKIYEPKCILRALNSYYPTLIEL